MKTRTVTVTRWLRLVKEVTVEITDGLTNEELRLSLAWDGKTTDLIQHRADKYEMTEDEEYFEVEDATKPADKGFSMQDPDWIKALQDDDLLNLLPGEEADGK